MDQGLVLVPSPQALLVSCMLDHPPDGLRVSRMLDHPLDGLRVRLVPDVGFEPATFGLQNRCSTN